MNDIVERAREEAALCRAETADDIAALLDALADEIERLRAELAEAKRDAEAYVLAFFALLMAPEADQ